jgi:hypothetical protein
MRNFRPWPDYAPPGQSPLLTSRTLARRTPPGTPGGKGRPERTRARIGIVPVTGGLWRRRSARSNRIAYSLTYRVVIVGCAR